MITVLWAIYGYSLAFTTGNAFIGGFDRLFLKGIFDPVTGKASPMPQPSAKCRDSRVRICRFQATLPPSPWRWSWVHSPSV